MVEKQKIGFGLILMAGLGAIAYLLFKSNKDKNGPISDPIETIEEYYTGKDEAAEEGGIVAVKSFCAEKWGNTGLFYDRCIIGEHDKMLAQIANHNYSGCVTAYKRCHVMPEGGWKGAMDAGEQYEFCREGILNYKEHVSPIIVEIVDQGVEILIHPESARTREKDIIHPQAYSWITNNTECTDLSCLHYHDYAIGWQDARINGYSENDSQFPDKVREFAGMKKKWFGRGWKW